MSSTASGQQLQPSYDGFIAETIDALLLFEGIFSGNVPIVQRRPHDRERPALIRHGAVFIFDEHASGIKRWTDGVAWSPSRIQGNFLLYRELDKPFGPGEKKKAQKRPKKTQRSSDPNSPSGGDSPTSSFPPPADSSRDVDQQRSLVGSLVDSYQFKEGGLMKKTMSMTLFGALYHLVSYYLPEQASTLTRPVHHSVIGTLLVRPEIAHQTLKVQLTEAELQFVKNGPELQQRAIHLEGILSPNSLPLPGTADHHFGVQIPISSGYHHLMRTPSHPSQYAGSGPYQFHHQPATYPSPTTTSYYQTASPHHNSPSTYAAHVSYDHPYTPMPLRREIPYGTPTTQQSQPRTFAQTEYSSPTAAAAHSAYQGSEPGRYDGYRDHRSTYGGDNPPLGTGQSTISQVGNPVNYVSTAPEVFGVTSVYPTRHSSMMATQGWTTGNPHSPHFASPDAGRGRGCPPY